MAQILNKMKKKVLILGSGGMLGHMVLNYFLKLNKYCIVDSSYSVKVRESSILIDATDKKEVENLILNVKPDIVINCIGILLKGSQEDPSNAICLNSYLPHFISKILKSYGGKLIHVSTDCVFSGSKGSYVESDFKDARDTYGLSKALGEINNDTDVTLRTSIIGPEIKKNGEGLFHWFMHQKGEINGFTKMIWGGVTTLELAKVINAVIDQNIKGLIHITNKEPISKYKLLLLMKEVWNKDDVNIRPVDGNHIDKSLKSNRTDFKYVVPKYKEMLLELNNWMKEYSYLYQNNYQKL